MRQEVCRAHAADRWALDDVVLASDVMRFVDGDAVSAPPKEGVYVHGLFLEVCWVAEWQGTARRRGGR